jgi:5-methylcytosine-specific restriction endonuclease McrA
MRVLILDAFYSPVEVVGWEKAFTLLFSDKAEVLQETDIPVRTISTEFKLPLVMKRKTSKYYNRFKRPTAMNKANIYYRDLKRCNYCDVFLAERAGTLDHIVPKSRGGENTWENLTLACIDCNTKKANKLLSETGMRLIRPPKKPDWDIIRALKLTDKEVNMFEDWLKGC